MNYQSPMGISWYWWLCAYTSPGLAYATYHLFKEYFNRPSDFVKGMLEAIGQAKKKGFLDHLLETFAYTIATLCIALGWPAFFVWSRIKAKKDAAREIERNKPEFICMPKYLVAKVDPQDAEKSNYVNDPLGYAPALPFGHLNQAWGSFLSNMIDPEDELWSFHIPKGNKCGMFGMDSSGDISGYAKVRNGQILEEFIVEID
ncbi:hypothetical protein [Polynucleobacter sp. AM-7D1]|uniref:hypothetical protein n=1 Tax=Polynucleobacter sp. AM-7D1 TaxID=2689102 RepID=UPI001BFD25CE|nr:hypothetical protein [Polynucleobacter sp. AM-7D1]QWE27930.1 hypothetical protein GQ359_05780 [Polynucleobacter sp. AM-7D1]